MSRDDLEKIMVVLEKLGVEILDAEHLLIRCVGTDKHTTPNSLRDCKVFANPGGLPQAFCQHQSCAGEVWDLNGILRRVFPKVRRRRYRQAGMIAPPRRGPESVQIAPVALQKILNDYRWSEAEIIAESPTQVPDPDVQDWLLALSLFADSDNLWIGRDVRDTGAPGHRWRFRPMIEWMAQRECPGTFTCPSTFVSGTHSRSRENVLDRRYLVVESDVLSRDEIGAIFQYLMAQFDLRLRAVVDTAGKSLHAWFEYPSPGVMGKLTVLLPALSCDPALLNPSQPCRLPGALRDGKPQKLIYFEEV